MVPTLSDQQREMVQSVRALAQEKFRGRAERWLDGTFPWENIRDLAALGVLGMAVPEEYGGLGLPVFDTALVLEEIAKVCYPTAMAVLGEVGAVTLDAARDTAREWLAQIRKGIDPAAEARRRADQTRKQRQAERIRDECRFERVADDYLKRRAAGQRRRYRQPPVCRQRLPDVERALARIAAGRVHSHGDQCSHRGPGAHLR